MALAVVFTALLAWSVPASAKPGTIFYMNSVGGGQDCGAECGDETFPFSYRLFRVGTDGSDRRRIPCSRRISPRVCDEPFPLFSPNGKMVASRTENAVLVGRRPGKTRVRIPLKATLISWAPGSKRLAILTEDRLYLAPIDGGKPRLRLELAGIESVAWSPEGDRLAVGTRISVTEGGPDTVSTDGGAIYLVDRGGSGSPRLLDDSGAGVFSIQWPRPGTLTWQRLSNTTPWAAIMVTNPVSRRVRVLVKRGDVALWSPTANRFLYPCYRGLCMSSADGKRKRLLGRCAPFDYGYVWSPDGRRVACGNDRGDLIALTVRTGSRKLIARRALPEALTWQR